ncbi:MAG: error-prone DNA polymerase [Microthrixaceae bacterium]
MGFNNPDIPWCELERTLSDRPKAVSSGRPKVVHPGDGSDSPAWSRSRLPYEANGRRARGAVPYAELHAHSNFSFLDGASDPEALVEEAARLGLEALALCDHNGFYGVVRFAEAARAVGMPTVFGAEVTVDAPKGRTRTGVADPPGRHLVVLARNPAGYARLGRALSSAQMAGEKNAPRIGLDELAVTLRGTSGGSGNGSDDHLILTGCRKGAVVSALYAEGPAAATRELRRLCDLFGRDNVAVELWDHDDPLDAPRNDALVEVALAVGCEPIATNNVHYATPDQRRLATALAAVRARCSLDELDGWIPGSATAHLRSGVEQARRFARYGGVVEAAARLGRGCAFDLGLVAPGLPPFECPPGPDGAPLSEMAYLRVLVEQGATRRYGAAGSVRQLRFETMHGKDPRVQLAHELDLVERLGFAGYFLIVWDIVEFCRRNDILCQGRGSAANSAVCYALGVTNADAVALGVLFERFLSPERDGPPDIDLDIESKRREEVIQYVYGRYGRTHAAQVANVITYRAKSSIRDMARALGFAPGQQDAWSKEAERWGALPEVGTQHTHDMTVPDVVLDMARQVLDAPRHLGIHSGGMVICDRPVTEVCPVEWGRMENRSVLQWDKEDCAAIGLVKFDLLGLGMLGAIHETIDLVAEHHGVTVDLAHLPQEDAVYDMICAADTVGVFQIESRAQMATLPRLRPRTFYDLVVEVALIRPGPIQGGSVHPYIRRRNGTEPVTYLHPLLERSLAKTLGVPLFQEQLMQMAIDVAGFTAGEADRLRQAMGSKRSVERMERLRERLYAGMAERGIVGEVADRIYDKLVAFASYGFPESHSVSFAYLVYASSWLKFHYPAAFCAGLLRSQPMGFYSPHSLCLDAERHGVVVHGPCVEASGWQADLEPCTASTGGVAVRLGLHSVRHVGDDLAQELDAGRPYRGIEDVARRGSSGSGGVRRKAMEALATAGALRCFDRRDKGSLGCDRSQGGDEPPAWSVRRSAQRSVGSGGGGGWWPVAVGGNGAGGRCATAASDEPAGGGDRRPVGHRGRPRGHPTRFLREELSRMGVLTAAQLEVAEPDRNVTVAGVVTHRQRPATAGGTMFVNLEDETGLINVVCSPGCWARYRGVARRAPAMLVRGRLERADGVVNVVAHRLQTLPLAVAPASRDFR